MGNIKTIETVKIGDFVAIKETDSMIKIYISESILTGINIEKLRLLCSISEKKKYKVIDVCKPCKTVRVESDGLYTQIRYKFIHSVYEGS